MSDSGSKKTSDKPPVLALSIFVLAVVLVRVWVVAEQLRNHHPTCFSTRWVDVYGEEHTITLTTSPGSSFSEFLVQYQNSLNEALRTYPRKP
jgi:hypothetical protein